MKAARKLITIDLSMESTGFAVFDIETKQLEDFGLVKPNKKGLTKFNYPKKQLLILKSTAQQLREMIQAIEQNSSLISYIYIEEVNRGLNRISQKSLDGAHWMLANELDQYGYLERVKYIDSDADFGWRKILNLKLTENDKVSNALNSKLNKGLKSKDKLVIFNKKHLAARIIQAELGLQFDIDNVPGDSDRCDAIGIGLALFKTEKII